VLNTQYISTSKTNIPTMTEMSTPYINSIQKNTFLKHVQSNKKFLPKLA